MTKKTAARKRRLVRLYWNPPSLQKYWSVKFKDASKRIEFLFQISDALMLRATRGIPWTCVLAEAIMEHAVNHVDDFGHPVLFAYAQPGSIYIVTKADGGTPSHAVRYFSNGSELIHSFDNKNITQKMLMAKYPDGFTLRLRPAKKHGGHEASGARDTRPRNRVNPKPHLSIGALRRAREAGLVSDMQISH